LRHESINAERHVAVVNIVDADVPIPNVTHDEVVVAEADLPS
jgi:hypothetical protein